MTDKIERTLDLLYLISTTLASNPQLSRTIEPSQITAAIEDLSSFVPDQDDEYLALDAQQSKRDHAREAVLEKETEFLKQDNAEMRIQIRDLTEEVQALREVNISREEVLTSRLDTLQQELHMLRQERAKLYDSAAGIEEAVHSKVRVEAENEELKRINKQVSTENDRLRKTNGALTQQLFEQRDAGVARLSLADPSSPASQAVSDILSGRRDEGHEGLLRLLVQLQREFDDFKFASEREREALHAKMRLHESVDRVSSPLASPPGSPSRLPTSASDQMRGAVYAVGSSVSSLFQAATSQIKK